MASTNQSPFYIQAEEKFLAAKNIEDKLIYLDEMIRECPKHKSSEKMLAQLRIRRKKLIEQQEKSKKSGKSSRHGIKKEDMQVVIVGFSNSGKSSLIKNLTNTDPKISEIRFTTLSPLVGMMNYATTQIQIIEIPAIDSEYYDKGIVNTSDVILILINSVEEIKNIEKILERAQGKKIIVLNKIDHLDEIEKRKVEATLQSRKYNFCMISTKTGIGVEELKNKIFQSFDKIRVYTKEPGKEKSEKPIIMPPNSDVKDVAEKILKGFSKKVKETKIWGPSSKFPGQKVGLNHPLKDSDIVEFKTK
jgi:hypothetical protein